MNKSNGAIVGLKVGLSIAMLAAVVGCVGVVGEGYGGEVVAPGPDLFLFGGGFDRGREVHAYSHRGFVSRGVAHGGGHGGGRGGRR